MDPEIITKEQLYKLLHISKRKAKWMLDEGIIPCQIRSTKTHRYIIRREDVEAYLQKKRDERRKEIPVGIFNAKPTKQTVAINNNRPMDTVNIAECFITIADECRDEFCAHIEKRLQYFPDAITVDKAAGTLTVSDNGIGMTEEQCREILRKEPGDRTGIGIKNVNDRIKIYFGSNYGLNITSELDEGTCVTIRMPKVREEEYEKK